MLSTFLMDKSIGMKQLDRPIRRCEINNYQSLEFDGLN